MLSRVLVLILLPLHLADADTVTTHGGCAPVTLGDSNRIHIECFIDDAPIEAVVRRGEVDKLLEAIGSGLAPGTIIQSFVLGPQENFSGVDFFRQVDEGSLRRFLDGLSQEVNLNERIYFREGAFTSLFWLAAEAKRPSVMLEMARIGMAIHVPDHREGGDWDVYLSRQFFPIVDLIKSGSLTLNDGEIIEEMMKNSFIYPAFSASRDAGRDELRIGGGEAYRLLKEISQRKSLLERVPLGVARQSYDMANVPRLCALASRSGDTDWCQRLREVSIEYNSEGGPDLNWPDQIRLIGLMEIRTEFAVFLAHHTREWGGLAFFYVPRKGTTFGLAMWNEHSIGTCWDEKLNRYDKSCWRAYAFEQDLFDPRLFSLADDAKTFQGSAEKVDW